jgi:CubicO group peptidase (beta-lactamase class C family)
VTVCRLALVLIGACGCSPGANLEPLRSPLLSSRSAAELAADLGTFVPAGLARSGVPGVSLAVVRDGEILFASGYGVANVLTRTPVTPRTAFEVASNSKPVAAYAALMLVEAGALELDAPLASFLQRPFLPTSPRHERMTLRHVLSHSSGLSNLGVGLFTDRRLWFEPGDHFSYSGHGYGYLGRALEDTAGEPLAGHLERVVLDPLGMTESGYRLEGTLAEHLAYPHLPAGSIAGVALALVLLAAIPVFVLGWLGPRLLWLLPALPRPPALSLAAASLVGGAILAAFVLGLATATVAFSLLCGLAGLLGAALLAARGLRGGRPPEERAPRALHAGAAVVCLGLAGWAITRPALPLPRRQYDIVAAGGLLSTAPDLARFLVELMAPTRLSTTRAREMLSPQVRIDDSLAWGLGIGLQHTESGDSIWHWGQNPGFESLMIGYPSEQLGVVVLTNGGPGLAGLTLAREIAHRAIGGEHGSYWMDVPGTGLPVAVDP